MVVYNQKILCFYLETWGFFPDKSSNSLLGRTRINLIWLRSMLSVLLLWIIYCHLHVLMRFIFSAGPQVSQDVMRGNVSPKPARPSPVQTVNEERLPSKRYSLTRREARPGVEERIELGPFKGRGRGRAENKSNIIRPSSSSPLIGSSGPCLSGGSPVIGSKSSMEAFDHQTSNALIKSNSTEQFANSASPEKREEMVHTLKKVIILINIKYMKMKNGKWSQSLKWKYSISRYW